MCARQRADSSASPLPVSQRLQEDIRLRRGLLPLPRQRGGPRSPKVCRARSERASWLLTWSPRRSVLSKDDKLKSFELAQIANLCPLDAEEAKALIPRCGVRAPAAVVLSADRGCDSQSWREGRRRTAESLERDRVVAKVPVELMDGGRRRYVLATTLLYYLNRAHCASINCSEGGLGAPMLARDPRGEPQSGAARSATFVKLPRSIAFFPSPGCTIPSDNLHPQSSPRALENGVQQEVTFLAVQSTRVRASRPPAPQAIQLELFSVAPLASTPHSSPLPASLPTTPTNFYYPQCPSKTSRPSALRRSRDRKSVV